jgi:hypothetical protein
MVDFGAKMNRRSKSSSLLENFLSYAVPSIDCPDLSPFGETNLHHDPPAVIRVSMRTRGPGEY